MTRARSGLIRAACAATALAAPLGAQAPVNYAAGDPAPNHQTFTIDSRTVRERRVINVHLPPGYEGLPGRRYPVVYMPDGGMMEDFPHVANTIDSLVERRAIAPVILVGIENTERRRDMTGPTTIRSDSAIAPRVGGSAAFRGFLRDELLPEIARRYRTTDDRAIVGESLAGLFIVETFLLEPGLFRRYIALSPSLWWNGGSLLRLAPERLKVLAGHAATLYLTSAGEPGIAKETTELAGILTAGAPASLRWFHEPRPDLEHGTIYRKAGPGALATVLDHDPG